MLSFRDRDKDTICAVSTPPGLGGISVIRLSGPATLELLRPLATFLPASPESHRAYYGWLRDPSVAQPLDEVLITWFSEGRSFTGETTAEISCHGNPLICREILRTLIDRGARSAEPGEFTSRAFLNGRLDLVQAESVLALIESRSAAASRLALRQLHGDLSDRIRRIEDDVTWALAHIEASIDFSTEGLDVVSNAGLDDRLDRAEKELVRLVDSFRQGRVLKDGLRVAFAGRPNVGKSSLLNNFLEEDRAIVSDLPGTTRDVVEGETFVHGLRVVFLDTAGLREATDVVERMGIERSHRTQSEADMVFFVFDASEGWTPFDEELIARLDPKRLIVLANKSDRLSEDLRGRVLEQLKMSDFFRANGGISEEKVFFVSALDKTARQGVLDRLAGRFQTEQAETSSVLSSARHHEKLGRSLEAVRSSRSQFAAGVGAEFVAIDLKEALLAVQETLGKRFDDQIMDRVFKEFCIGK